MPAAGSLTNVAGEPLSPDGVRLLEYLRSRAEALTPVQLRDRVRAAMKELDAALAGLGEPEARRQLIPGEWTIAQVVDHVAQTQIRAADELRHLLAGRRPPAPPVYDALTSGAVHWARWPELVDGLQSANAEFDAVLSTTVGAPAPPGLTTARSVLVVNRTAGEGPVSPEIFVVELGWKAYALVQRLHCLDHRTQVRNLRAALAP